MEIRFSDETKLTEFSHGAGCGSKIASSLLDKILATSRPSVHYPALLVGNNNKDDAAAYDLGNGTSVLSTIDFFLPIVDDPFLFGKIAAANALSDIYAMGGKPIMAVSVFIWPIDKLSAATGARVMDGAREACEEAGIPLAGGHSIDSLEPIFGLSVTGTVENKHLRQNSMAKQECEIFLTKQIGTGILSTAQKKKMISEEELMPAVQSMARLNKLGAAIAEIPGVATMTDVTGFGLLGHLIEVCEASGISAEIDFESVPLLPHTEKYRAMGALPGGMHKNFKSYGHKVSTMSERAKEILCDAQTSGGLLVFVERDSVEQFLETAKRENENPVRIGKTTARQEYTALVKE